MKIGYARVSTVDQNLHLQRRTCKRRLSSHFSGAVIGDQRHRRSCSGFLISYGLDDSIRRNR